MDVYDTTAHSVTDDGISNCEEIITRKEGGGDYPESDKGFLKHLNRDCNRLIFLR